jgi:hypothetical protein
MRAPKGDGHPVLTLPGFLAGYSRSDGIVNWRTCILRPSDTAEKHRGALREPYRHGRECGGLVGGREPVGPQAEGQFAHFDRSGPFAIAYAPPENAQS